MGKSVYSIVLDDKVVERIDELAYRSGTNRSGLINSILAEHTGCVTPEMRMREIFALVEQALEPRFLPQPQPSGSVLLVKTALRYRYKPTVKYSVELFRSFSGCVGRLKVALRSQSAVLNELCGEFFAYWAGLEKLLTAPFYEGGVPCGVMPNGYTRDFFAAESNTLTDEDIADGITAYIRCFDMALSACVEAGSIKSAAARCEELYREYLAADKKIL
ncbi:MAG: ribbon-helix-helix domain-containing protein [Ruminococcus sp.]|nr:ribbon-helix-helix domain-containing protein [Ruminococcus sp.]